jgi:hypothetical protein
MKSTNELLDNSKEYGHALNLQLTGKILAAAGVSIGVITPMLENDYVMVGAGSMAASAVIIGAIDYFRGLYAATLMETAVMFGMGINPQRR